MGFADSELFRDRSDHESLCPEIPHHDLRVLSHATAALADPLPLRLERIALDAKPKKITLGETDLDRRLDDALGTELLHVLYELRERHRAWAVGNGDPPFRLSVEERRHG